MIKTSYSSSLLLFLAQTNLMFGVSEREEFHETHDISLKLTLTPMALMGSTMRERHNTKI